MYISEYLKIRTEYIRKEAKKAKINSTNVDNKNIRSSQVNIENDINAVKIATLKKWNWNEIAKLKPAK